MLEKRSTWLLVCREHSQALCERYVDTQFYLWKCHIELYPLKLFLQGLAFVNMLHKFWTENKFNPQVFETECQKWVLLLLNLVDVTGDNPHIHFEIFLGKSSRTRAMKEYRADIVKRVSRGRPLDRFRLIYRHHSYVTHPSHPTFR